MQNSTPHNNSENTPPENQPAIPSCCQPKENPTTEQTPASSQKIDYNLLFVILGVALLALVGADYALVKKDRGLKQANILNAVIQPASAKDIFPIFLCPCCGLALNPDNICCPLAQERIDFINAQAQKNLSQDEIVLAYAQKYGLDSFIDKNKQKEFQDKLVASAPAEKPQISITPSTFDLGDVSVAKGTIFTFFTLKNEGQKDLIINKLDSSCGCTSASIVYQDNEGPRFAMAGHGITSPTDWQITIPPGGEAKVKVYYDPSVHMDFRGAATREISIYSNDPINFESKVTVELNQVD